MSDNLEKSQVVIARILQRLMDHGLQRGDLSFKDLQLGEEYRPFVPTCFDWLMQEGIVRATSSSTTSDGAFFAANPVLTAHGFAVLGKTFNTGSDEIVLAQAVTMSAQSGRSLSSLGDLIGGFLGGFTKSMGS